MYQSSRVVATHDVVDWVSVAGAGGDDLALKNILCLVVTKQWEPHVELASKSRPGTKCVCGFR